MLRHWDCPTVLDDEEAAMAVSGANQREESIEPDVPRQEPHRALAEAVLSNAAEQAEWLADGGPEPALPAAWSGLWQAAVQRQMDLSGQAETVASQAVSSTMSQLATLYHEAAWFRTDDDLRRRATNEVLFYGTELRTKLRSQSAQEAWQRRSAYGLSASSSAVRARVTANDDWLTGWQAWAAAQQTS
ncbi:hypothetical protein [Winogradskya humida]|nr:hypothetical protein [Actinoplanes humidus]